MERFGGDTRLLTRRRVGRRAQAAALATALCAAVAARADGIDLAPGYLPNYFGVGVGFAPDYIGSDDFRIAAAPIGRASWGNRYLEVVANFASANVLDHPNWKVGPAGTFRPSRDDVDDAAVRRLPDVDAALELGGFLAYETNLRGEPRRRLRVGASLAHDVTGAHDGYVASASVRKWFPVAQFAAVGVSLGTSYGSGNYADSYFSVTPGGAAASGLQAFDADAGFRDVRATAMFVQPVSPRILLGVGALYGRLLGDAGDSPIVGERGSRDQFIFGLGGAVLF